MLPPDWLPPLPDPRTDSYMLLRSWLPTGLITLAYLIVVCFWRNKLQTKRMQQNASTKKEHFNPAPNAQWDKRKKDIVLGYNLMMVCYSLYLAIDTVFAAIELNYGLGCAPKPDPFDPRTNRIFRLCYLMTISKIVELTDTLFFLWRDKLDQVTFLHVVHHAAMPITCWFGTRFAPGGLPFTFIVANSFVHVLMYTYYGMASAGMYRYLWWKKYLTIFQMIQFVSLIIHQGQLFYRSTPCNYPKLISFSIIVYSVFFLFLFANFYVNAYWRKKRLAKVDINGRVGIDAKSDANQSISNGHVHRVNCGDVKERKRFD